jgi:hypothetical protein
MTGYDLSLQPYHFKDKHNFLSGPHAIKMTTFALIFEGKLYTIEILCTRRFIKYIVQKCSCSLCATSRRIRIQRDSAMVMKMIEFVHDHGPH